MKPIRDTIRAEVHRLVRAGELDLSRAADDGGVFGLNAVAQTVHRDFSAMLMGGVAALLTQMLHPGALAGVWDHSDWAKDPGGRLARTAQFVGATTYGSSALAARMIARVTAIHARVSGVLPEGTPYSATDPALLTWVHVVEADAFLRAHLRYRDPALPGARQDRYLAEMAGLARRLGATHVPETRRAVAAYFRQIRPQLRYDDRTRAVAGALLRQPARDGMTAPMQRIVMEAGVELMQPWAAALHGRSVPAHRRPAIRAGATATAGVLRWALA